MLATHANDVGAPLCRVEQQREGEPCPWTNGVPRLERLNVGFAPCPIAIALDLGTPNAARWIISAYTLCDAVLHHCAESLQKLIGCLRRAGFGGEYGLNVIWPQ